MQHTCQIILSCNSAAGPVFRQDTSYSSDVLVLVAHDPLDKLAHISRILVGPSVDLASAPRVAVSHVFVIGHGMSELLGPVLFGAGQERGDAAAVGEGHAHVGYGRHVVIVVVEGMVQCRLGEQQDVSLGNVDDCVQHRGTGRMKSGSS